MWIDYTLMMGSRYDVLDRVTLSELATYQAEVEAGISHHWRKDKVTIDQERINVKSSRRLGHDPELPVHGITQQDLRYLRELLWLSF